MKNSRSGFTLVELMIVAVIVAILAAVAIPLMAGNKKRAMCTEAETALGTARTALRVVYAETGRYDKRSDGTDIAEGANQLVVGNVPGISVGDFNGKYFLDGAYRMTAIDSNTYTVTAVGTGELTGVSITLDETGTFGRTGL